MSLEPHVLWLVSIYSSAMMTITSTSYGDVTPAYVRDPHRDSRASLCSSQVRHRNFLNPLTVGHA